MCRRSVDGVGCDAADAGLWVVCVRKRDGAGLAQHSYIRTIVSHGLMDELGETDGAVVTCAHTCAFSRLHITLDSHELFHTTRYAEYR